MILLPGVGVAAQPVPPDADYRTIETEHFRITYPSRLEILAPVAAAHAEAAHRTLTESFLPPPGGTIDLLLTDHTDASNGVARIFPSPRLVIWAQPPVEGLALSHYDDWLELVIVHELVHVFHLDHAGTPGSIVRSVMGRVPWTWPAFPGYAIAPLGIEGAAVHLESLHTAAGRVNGGYHDAIVRARALGGELDRVDQGLGRSPVWPGGDRPYVFGGEFYRHLSERYGEPAVVGFLDAVAGQWIPYRLDAAAEEAFGVDFESLWAEWIAAVELEAAAFAERTAPEGSAASTSAITEAELLTEGARYAFHPAPGPDDVGIVYTRRDGRSETSLVLWTESGERRITRWNGTDRPRWTPDGALLVPQAEYVDTYHIYRDLHRVTPAGEVTRLTTGLRVLHADPHPTDGTVVAVLGDGGETRLVLLAVDGTELRALGDRDGEEVWSYPAWSPGGAWIAAVRRGPEGRSAIVVLDAAGEIREVVVEDRSLNTAPAWSPAGDALLWSSDRGGTPNLHAVTWDTEAAAASAVRRVTRLSTAATFPSVDPRGEWIYLSVLTADGWELGRVPYAPELWPDAAPPVRRFRAESDPAASGGASGRDEATVEIQISEARPYSAFPTVLPRYWEPIRIDRGTVLGRRVLPVAWGARTSGEDLVGRHEYALELAGPLEDPGSRAEWRADYRWAGLGNPVLGLQTVQAWDTRAPIAVEAEEDESEFVAPVLRERSFGGTAQLRRQRARSSLVLTAGGRSVDQDRYIFELDGTESDRYRLALPSSRLAEARLAVGYSTARGYDFSVSLEDGIAATAAVRQRWDRTVPDSLSGRSGFDGAFREAVGVVRGYRGFGGPGYADHVLAIRTAGGVSDGPAARTGHFAVGGRDRRFPVRGVPSGGLRGRAAWATSLEWRFPLVLVHRGAGPWPFYLDRLAGAFFVDAAGAERTLEGGGTDWDARSSVGLEIAATTSIFFESLDRLRLGLAVPLGPAGDRSGRATFYLATGWSF